MQEWEVLFTLGIVLFTGGGVLGASTTDKTDTEYGFILGWAILGIILLMVAGVLWAVEHVRIV